MPGRGFRLQAMVFDEAGDVRDTPAPQGYAEVVCGGKPVYARATSMPRVQSQGAQMSRVEVTMSLPDGVVSSGCELHFTLTDPLGNRTLPVGQPLPTS